MSTEGFADANAARDVYAMLHQAGEELHRLKVEALVELIDHRIDARRHAAAPGLFGRIALAARDLDRRMRAALKLDLGSDDVAQQQLLQSEELVAQLGKIIFSHRSAPLSVEDARATAAAIAAHRLSETRK